MSMENHTPQKLTRKAARLQVNQALSTLLDLENSLGKRKFQQRLERVEKILSEGLPKGAKSKQPKITEAA
jgi:hypothetical protein